MRTGMPKTRATRICRLKIPLKVIQRASYSGGELKFEKCKLKIKEQDLDARSLWLVPFSPPEFSQLPWLQHFAPAFQFAFFNCQFLFCNVLQSHRLLVAA